MTQLPDVGPFTALVLLAEIGDITRFASARKPASWVGLTPAVRGSDRTVRHGHISKQGPAWVRWILCEAAQKARHSPPSWWDLESFYVAGMSALSVVGSGCSDDERFAGRFGDFPGDGPKPAVAISVRDLSPAVRLRD